MEAHPIPQNVTSFQFKLVGDMTLKQFLYLATGVGLAYTLFVFFSHDYPVATYPLMAVSAILGISFAFLPIQSRPLDHWLAAFLRAVYSPTYRVWKKNNKTFKEDLLFSSRLVMYLAGTNQTAQNNSDKPENQRTREPENRQSSTPILQSSDSSGALSPSESFRLAEPLPTQEELGKTVDLARKAQKLQMQIIQTERTLSQLKTETQKPSLIPIDYSQQVNKILTDLQNMITQASDIKQQMQQVQAKAPKAENPLPLPIPREKIKVVIPAKPKQATVALTTFPNIISGIVKDAQGNYLESTVAVIYDKEGLPVRALKTNKLGQFTGATPLPSGTYTLELEKDNFSFDVLQIELTGQVLPPLLIIARS